MSWFSRAPKAPRAPTSTERAIAELRAWRAIGESFQYLGRECVVTGHYESSFHQLGCHTWPELKADYADDLGVIRNVRFNMAEARALMAKQPRGESA